MPFACRVSRLCEQKEAHSVPSSAEQMCAETAAVDIKKEPAGKDSDNSVPARLARHILHENWYTWTVKEKVEFVKSWIGELGGTMAACTA